MQRIAQGLAQREMGPALRPTPLSPAVGSRGERLSPDVSKAACRPKPIACDVVTRRSRRCRFHQGPVPVRRPSPTARRFRDHHVDPVLQTDPALPEGVAFSSALDRQSGLPTLRPRGFNAFEIGIVRRRSCSLGSTTRHLAIASIRFQNPFSVAGLSAFASEGPIPVSMSGRCAVRPIRATA
jgi:hypothetical protein